MYDNSLDLFSSSIVLMSVLDIGFTYVNSMNGETFKVFKAGKMQ